MASWHPTDDDIRRVLAEQNPWHLSNDVPDVLAPPVQRSLAQHLWKRLLADAPRRFHLILGPRRVGKTTAMYQTVAHVLDAEIPAHRLWWLRLDHPLLLSSPLDVLVRAAITEAGATAAEPLFLFLDELVYADRWDLWLKTFFDDRWPVRIVATSSATAALHDGRAESGVGRWDEHYLAPYSFSEYVELLGDPPPVTIGASLHETIQALRLSRDEARALAAARRRFLLVGGFPELLVGASSADTDEGASLLRSQQVLRSDAVERAIYKDIPQSFGVDNPTALERLLYVLAAPPAGLLSPTSIGQQLGLSQPTVDRYLSYLQRAFLVFALPNYSGREMAVQKRGRKLYFVDGAVRNAALQRGLAPLTNSVEMGMLTENLVAANLHAYAQHRGARLYHWRDRQAEVDLLLDEPDAPLAVEVGLSADHPRRALTALAERHPRFEAVRWVSAPEATTVAPQRTSAGIGTVSIDALLLAIGRHADEAARRRLLVE